MATDDELAHVEYDSARISKNSLVELGVGLLELVDELSELLYAGLGLSDAQLFLVVRSSLVQERSAVFPLRVEAATVSMIDRHYQVAMRCQIPRNP